MHMHRYNGVSFKPVLVPQATHPKCCHGSCRHNQTKKMDGDVLVPLEPRYYCTLETGMIVTDLRSRARCARRKIAPLACTKCISTVVINPECWQSASFMPSRLEHTL